MYSLYTHSKRKEGPTVHDKVKILETSLWRFNHNKRRDNMAVKYSERVKSFLKQSMTKPVRHKDHYSFNRVSDKYCIPQFRFMDSQQERVAKAKEEQALLLDLIPLTEKHQFRDRHHDKEIGPDMRYTAKNNLERVADFISKSGLDMVQKQDEFESIEKALKRRNHQLSMGRNSPIRERIGDGHGTSFSIGGSSNKPKLSPLVKLDTLDSEMPLGGLSTNRGMGGLASASHVGSGILPAVNSPPRKFINFGALPHLEKKTHFQAATSIYLKDRKKEIHFRSGSVGPLTRNSSNPNMPPSTKTIKALIDQADLTLEDPMFQYQGTGILRSNRHPTVNPSLKRKKIEEEPLSFKGKQFDYASLACHVLGDCNVRRQKHIRGNIKPLLKGEGKVSATMGSPNKIFARIYKKRGLLTEESRVLFNDGQHATIMDQGPSRRLEENE